MAKNKEKCEIRTVAVLSRLGYQAKRNPLICEFLIYNIHPPFLFFWKQGK